jgi:uncharacterized protein (DUF1501 family)
MTYTRRELWNTLVDSEVSRQSQFTSAKHTLVVVFMRGAVDGLNVVVPHGSDDYYARRPVVRVPRPDQSSGALDLDGFFGLHPSLAALLPAWQNGRMAAVHAAGSPHESRSHFDAQAIMESGVQDPSATLTGWLGRHIAHTHSGPSASPFRSVAIASAAPQSLQGSVPPLALAQFDRFNSIVKQGDDFLDAVRSMYGDETALSIQSRLSLDVVQALAAADPASLEPHNGAQYANNAFARNMRKAAQLIRADIGSEFISVDIGGWDTHVNQNGAMRNNLAAMGDGLAAFMQDLGDAMSRVTVVTMSEFGRRATENGSLGTDHGHGNAILLMGAGVNGGQVVSDWPGLQDDDLDRGDLQVTTDYRQVLSELLQTQSSRLDIARVFPGYNYPGGLGLFR